MGNGTNNELANAIHAAGDKEKYDENIKNILANKSILAWILKYTTDEFRCYDIPVIMGCIENPEVGEVLLHPGRSNSPEQITGSRKTDGCVSDDRINDRINDMIATNEKITGMPNEDKIPGEGEVRYDIRFSVYKPSEGSINESHVREAVKLIINVEAQKNFYPGYNIITRALFYCARLLSAQLGTEFTAKKYDDIKKVYSMAVHGYQCGICEHHNKL